MQAKSDFFYFQETHSISDDANYLSIENTLTGWLDKFPNATLLLGGDFNSIFDDNLDKLPHGQPIRANTDLKSFMDIWRVKFPDIISFTWSNKSGSVQSRIDF